MPIAQRTSTVVWNGSLAAGGGIVSSGSGALKDLPVTWAARTVDPEGKTSPEELIAAAHATCFTMALALVLGKAGTPPEALSTTAECVLDEVEGAPRITRVALDVRARVESLEEAAFAEAVEQASAICPVSNALRGNVDIVVNAELEAVATA